MATNNREPSVNIEFLGPFDLLSLSWQDTQIDTVLFDDCPLKGPIGGTLSPGSTSLWRIPHNPMGELYISAKGIDGKVVDYIHECDPFAAGTYDHYVRVELWPLPSGGVSAWGMFVQPIISMTASRNDAAETTIPNELLRMSITVQRRNRSTLRRQLHVLDPVVTGAIQKLNAAIQKAEVDWDERTNGGIMPEEELFNSLSADEAGISYLSQQGCEHIFTALRSVRDEGARALQAIEMTLGVSRAQTATQIWQDAAPWLVASKLTHEQITEAGLAPSTETMRLNPLVCSEGDLLAVTGMPERTHVEIALPRSLGDAVESAISGIPDTNQEFSMRPAGLAVAAVTGAGIAWSRHNEHSAESKVAQRVAELKQSWVAQAAQILEDEGFAPIEGTGDDLELLAHSAQAPVWLAAVARPSLDAFEHFQDFADLKASHFWTQPRLPVEIVRHTLGYLVQKILETEGVQQASLRPEVLDVQRGSVAFLTLCAIDSDLSSDPRYDDAINAAVKRMSITVAATSEGRLVALLLAIGTQGASADTFLEALSAKDHEAGSRIVRDALLLSSDPALVVK